MDTQRTFNNDEMDWIAAGLEAWPATPSDAVFMTSGSRIEYTTYSDTTFGEGWDWPNHCTHSTIKPWCYTHIISTGSGCSGCGVTTDPGQTHPGFLGPCENGFEACTNRWLIKLGN